MHLVAVMQGRMEGVRRNILAANKTYKASWMEFRLGGALVSRQWDDIKS